MIDDSDYLSFRFDCIEPYDDRIKCCKCKYHHQDEGCKVALKRQEIAKKEVWKIKGDHPRSPYHPEPNILRRCDFYAR
ncbi:MAG: hypothetical protein LLF94_08230 [Chlamydiales bacterium]|nr:hypothetical protein [Chlamydiales bacterium]